MRKLGAKLDSRLTIVFLWYFVIESMSLKIILKTIRIS